ncbi:MAG: tandem-95 repeat protein [Chloroflexi bacterium]|nr:tandem-95 repeat protein [Chloroflexota bacterium]
MSTPGRRTLARCLIAVGLVVALLVSLGGIATAGAPRPGAGPIELCISDGDNGRALDVKGEMLVLRLESTPSTGYSWQVKGLNARVLRQVGEAEWQPKTPGMIGASGTQVLRFAGIGLGKARLDLVYARPWESDAPPARSFSVDVSVAELSRNLSEYEAQLAAAQALALQEPETQAAPVQPGEGVTLMALPSAYDWRSLGGCTPVRDQGQCGSCWAFATVGPIESNILIQDGIARDLSEQYLVSCNIDDWGCDGGWWAHDYFEWKYPTSETAPGAVYESDFPYTATDAPCNGPYTHHERIADWAYVGNSSSVPSTTAIKQAILDHGPISAGVCVNSAFQSYTGGVFNPSFSFCFSINHGITLVGWDDSVGAWILRNSWGPDWGENGYMRIAYGKSYVGYAAAYVVYESATPNTPPTADPQSVATSEDTAVGIVLTGSDPDAGDTLTYALQTAPAHGTLSGTAPNLTYTPVANYFGGDSLVFVVNDGQENSVPATVSISVAAVNDAPVASAQPVETAQDTAVAITLTASDVEGDALSYAVVTPPTHGALSGEAPNVTYTPASGYLGTDSLAFVANDGQVDSAAATVSITVAPVNHAPEAFGQSVATDEDTPLSITLTGYDQDGDTLSFVIQSQPSKGTLSGAGATRTYTPNTNYSGADAFTFAVIDGTLTSAAATVSISVTAVNDAPVANGQSVTTAADTPVAITLTGSDVEGDALTYRVVSGPASGTLSGAAPSLTYTPNAGYSGADSLSFVANDGQVDSAAATVSITVTPAGDIVWLSLSANATLPGIGTVNDEDIVALNTATGAYTWVFDGSDVGIGGDIDAFDVLQNGHILMSFDGNQSVSGLGTAADVDIVEFIPTSLGATTTGTFAWKFDGSDVGLSSSSEDIDALYLLSDGSLLISARNAVTVTGASGQDEDLLRFVASSWGSTTRGAWSLYFDGSDVGLSTSSNEDVDALWVDEGAAEQPDIYLGTLGSFAVTGVSGTKQDIFVFSPTALGSTTSGTYRSTLFLDGSLFGLGVYDIDAFDVR